MKWLPLESCVLKEIMDLFCGSLWLQICIDHHLPLKSETPASSTVSCRQLAHCRKTLK